MAAGGMSKETKMSIEASSKFPGFRFSPTDVELISYYLKKKMEGDDKCVEVIPEVEFCRHEPWDLPAKSVIQSDTEWFFFAARGKKYPNGSQSKRATELGYWKATGKERNVKSGSDVIGSKRTLVFHLGRAPRGERTEWIMHEYCMSGSSQDSLVVCRLRKNVEFRLNDATSRPFLTQSNFSRAHDGSNTASGSDADRMRASQMHMAAEFSKKSISNESYSMEQFDSASENEQKQSNEISLAESSSRQKDSDNEEDFYADILKDDIVKLDETPFFAATSGFLPVAVSNTAIVSNPQQPVESMVSQAFPLQTIPIQGTPTRIIKLKRRIASAPLAQAAKSGAKEHPAEENNARRPEEQPKCVIDLLSIRPWLIPVVSVAVLLLVVLLLYLLGGPQQVIRRIAYATLYKASLFWH